MVGVVSLEEKFIVNILYPSESEILNGIDINMINFENLIKLNNLKPIEGLIHNNFITDLINHI